MTRTVVILRLNYLRIRTTRTIRTTAMTRTTVMIRTTHMIRTTATIPPRPAIRRIRTVEALRMTCHLKGRRTATEKRKRTMVGKMKEKEEENLPLIICMRVEMQICWRHYPIEATLGIPECPRISQEGRDTHRLSSGLGHQHHRTRPYYQHHQHRSKVLKSLISETLNMKAPVGKANVKQESKRKGEKLDERSKKGSRMNKKGS
mmetsp:Transcript_14705/g.25885  ORF Transcript_14705/g.25885 Transcript_14705/m.25885 type:complete len:204 (-) Transcript_14705:1276-1887(-)